MPIRCSFRLAILATLVLWNAAPQPLACAEYAGAESPPERFREGFDCISEERAKEWLAVLAGPSFEGRGTGQPGYTQAADWVAAKLTELGWKPLGENGTYFQYVPLTRIQPSAQSSFIAGPNELRICREKELGFTNQLSASTAVGKVVFINVRGAGQKLPDDLSLKDRLAVVVEKEAGLLGEIWKKEPAATIRVLPDEPWNSTHFVRHGTPAAKPGRIDAAVSEPAALRLAEAVGLPADMVKPLAQDGVKVQAVDVELTVELQLTEEPLRTPNVVAWFEGGDPAVNHEHVVIGAHLDHLGRSRTDVYLGADDNASGITAILQIAEAVSRNPEKPRRSVLFIAFAAEELGLFGSKYYCEQPLKPLDKLICMLNLDMVGRNEENDKETAQENEDTMHLVGSQKIAKGLHETALEANRHVNFKFEFDEEEKVFHRSDHLSFHEKGVPVAAVFCGFGPRYHRTTDTLEGINYHKIVSAARLGYLMLMLAAEHGPYERLPR